MLKGQLTQKLFYPLLLMPTRSRASAIARQIRRVQRWPREKIRALQLERTNQLLARAANTEFYQPRLADAGIEPGCLDSLGNFERLPITTKQDLELNFPDRMIDPRYRNADWQYIGTRGTTHRVMVIQDFARRDAGRAAIVVSQTEDSPYCYGDREVTIPPDACSVHCGIESDREPTVLKQMWSLASRKKAWNRDSVSDLRGLVMDSWIRNSISLPPIDLKAGDQELSEIMEQLRELRPQQLVALPEYLRSLAEYILRTGDGPPAIRIIRPMGANMPACWKPEVARAFGGQVREHYGSREMGPMAFDCGQADGMHLLMDQHLIEIVQDGRSVAPGELGSVLVSDLNNLAMPVLRYQIGDLAWIDDSLCPCGRQTPRIHLEGRREDALVSQSGELLTAEGIAEFFHRFESVQDYQIAQNRRGQWSVKVVPRSEREIQVDELQRAIESWLGDATPIRISLAQQIEPEASGKFRHSKGHPVPASPQRA